MLIPFDKMKYNPISEQIVQILRNKTQSNITDFFRISVAFHLTRMASMMHTKVSTKDRGTIPVNGYMINLASSGLGKGNSTNIIEEQLTNGFRNEFMDSTFINIADKNLANLAIKRFNLSTDPEATQEDMLLTVKKEFEDLGDLPFDYDSGTSPAFKQVRHKCLMAKIGALNFFVDEIGTNLLSNSDLLGSYLECYTGDVEVLTDKGFKRFDALSGKETIAQYSDKGTIEYIENQYVGFIKKPYKGKLFNFKTPTGFDFSVTDTHEVTLRHQNGSLIKKYPADINTADRIILSGKLVDRNINITPLMQLQLAFQADGTFRANNKIELAFTKKRKIKRLREILDKLNFPVKEYKYKAGHICFNISDCGDLVSKNLADFITVPSIDLTTAQDILEEITYWDGNKASNNRFTSTNKDNVDLISHLCVVSGRKSMMRKIEDNRSEKYSDIYYIDFSTKEKLTTGLAFIDKPSGNQPPIRSVEQFNGQVYCVSVPSTNIIVRRDGTPCINGNSYDVGKIKQKLIKNTAENKRLKEINGKVPSNLLLFGTPAKLLDGAKTEEEFISMLETGYARRCLFGYSKHTTNDTNLTPEEIYDIATSSADMTEVNKLDKLFTKLAEETNFNTTIGMTKEVNLKLIEYRQLCEKKAETLPEHKHIEKAELIHRYFKALKLSGTYAFIDSSPNVREEHLYAAIKLAEDSGEAFKRILTREKPHVRLAKFIGAYSGDLTKSDLQEELPSYKGSEPQKREMLTLAIAYGFRNNIIIKEKTIDGIDFYTGDMLEETDLNNILLSYSGDITQNYVNESIKFNELHKLTNTKDLHFVAHHLLDGYRSSKNIIQGFNLAIIDIDDGNTSIDMVKLLLGRYQYMLYTTKRHTDDKPRFRIIFPLSHILKLNVSDYKEFMINLFNWLPFKVDDQTSDIARKWLTYPGKLIYNDGELLNALPFIPKTKEADKRKKVFNDTQSLDNLQRWFVNNTGEGNRSNQLVKYAYALVDGGKTITEIQDMTLALNNKFTSPLPQTEVLSTVLISAASKIQENKDKK